jgi:inhibitor of KinA sporulation pathway (predicted exonuclease)
MKELQHTHSIYIDVEMTCWNGPPPVGMKQEIIEIGAVAMDLTSLEITQEKSYFVRPRCWEISANCTALTGITKKDIQSASSFQDVLAEFIEAFAPKGKLCGTWGDDADLIHRTCQERGLKSPLRHLVDVSHLFQRAFLLKDRVSLQKAVMLLGSKFDGAPHNALGDARNTALVHAAIIRRMQLSPEPQPITTAEPTEDAPKSHFGEKLANSLSVARKNLNN